LPKVIGIEAATAIVPLDNLTGFATRAVTERHYGLVRVHTEDGLTGIGFCYAGHTAGHLVADAALDLLAPRLLGQDPTRVEGLWQEMYDETLLHGRSGSVMRALSSLDIALWDRNAQAAHLPLWKYLGGFARDAVPAYASGGYYLDGKSPSDLAEETRTHVTHGFRAVKIKVGRVSLPRDVERLAAVREAVGPDVEIMLDANNAWRDLQSAVFAARAFEPHRPYWLEEPFSPDHSRLHSTLAGFTTIPIATGEIESGRWRHHELLEPRGIQVLQTDAAVCGGISEWRRIAAVADVYGVAMAPHWFHDLHVHLVAATPNATWVEFFPDDQVLNFRRLISAQLAVENGRVLLPRSPGLGFDFDEASADRYTQLHPWKQRR